MAGGVLLVHVRDGRQAGHLHDGRDAAGRPRPRPAHADPHPRQSRTRSARGTSGVATSSSTFFRQIGGTARRRDPVLGAVQPHPGHDRRGVPGQGQPRRPRGRGAGSRRCSPTRRTPKILELLQNGQNGGGAEPRRLAERRHLVPERRRPAAGGAVPRGVRERVRHVFWVGLVVVLVAFVLSFFLKAAPLREKSAMQEAADDARRRRRMPTSARRRSLDAQHAARSSAPGRGRHRRRSTVPDR